MSFLLDTNVISEITAPGAEPLVLAWLAGQDEKNLFLSAVTLGELRYGVEKLPIGAKRVKLQRNLDELTLNYRSRTILIDLAIADVWGRLRRRAEINRRTLPAIDAMLAATAEVRELTLVTRNIRDFEGWGGPVLNPWEPQPS